jgi:prevent-host-death family protein
MRTATIDEAKEHLAELIEAARAGERVVITGQGDIVATLTPPKQLVRTEASQWLSAHDWETLRRLKSAGAIDRFPEPDPEAIDKVPKGSSGVLQALFDERDESW